MAGVYLLDKSGAKKEYGWVIRDGTNGRVDLMWAKAVRVLLLPFVMLLLWVLPLVPGLRVWGSLDAQAQPQPRALAQSQGGAQNDVPMRVLAQIPYTVRWGIQRPDLVRYNRVEALSLGIRAQIRPQTFLGPLSMTATARIGIADREPNGRIDFKRETLDRRVTLSLFHELAAIDESARHLGIGNSLLAALAGRDDGDYYRRSGASFEWTPPEMEQQHLKLRGFAEYHRATTVETDFAVFKLGSDTFRFRDNLIADEGWVYGGQLAITPSWGSDPSFMQGGLELTAEAATGDFEYVRAALLARFQMPVLPDMRLRLEAGAGSGWGELTAQRMWHLGGPSSLRGYAPRRINGSTFARARGELEHMYSFGSISLFSDVGWAGESGSYSFDDVLPSVGVGLAILDGLLRLDSAWGLRDPRPFRFDVYLDAIL